MSKSEMELAKEHYQMAKERAYKYIERGDLPNALSSFESDMLKNETTAKVAFSKEIMMLKTYVIKDLNEEDLRKYIDGFPF